MSWTFNSVGATETTGAPASNRSKNVFKSATETLTVVASNASNQDLTTSVIDFIPKGSDFLVVANTAAKNMSSDADIAVLASATRGGTYGLLKDDLMTTTDAIVSAKPYIANSGAGAAGYGEAPYYKIFVDSDGVQKKDDEFTIAIFWT